MKKGKAGKWGRGRKEGEIFCISRPILTFMHCDGIVLSTDMVVFGHSSLDFTRF